MLRRAHWLAVVLAVASRAGADATAPLSVSAEATFGEAVRVVVTVDNTGSEPLPLVTPEVRYRLVERRGDPVTLAPSDRHAWSIEFPPPPVPSGDALIVVVHWQDATGTRRSLPYARVVDTPGLLPTEAQLLLEPQAAAGHERAVARITNATAEPLRARLVALIPDEFFTTPVAQPVEAAPREGVAVPIDVQSHGPPGTTYPLYAILQFEQGGIPRAIVAGTLLGIGTTPSRSALQPVTIGVAALLLALVILFAANRRAARGRTSRTS
jgi:hypothetical protein